MIACSSENCGNFDGNHCRQNMYPQISLLQRKENKEIPSPAPFQEICTQYITHNHL